MKGVRKTNQFLVTRFPTKFNFNHKNKYLHMQNIRQTHTKSNLKFTLKFLTSSSSLPIFMG